MAGFIHDRMDTGIRISLNKGKKSSPSRKVVLDGSRGNISPGRKFASTFGERSLASILGAEIGEVLDWKIKVFGQTLMDTLQSDPPHGTPVLTGLARANWQLSVVRSERSIGHTRRVLYREVLDDKNWNGWKANEVHRGAVPIPADYLRGITELDKFSSQKGDYGLIITNPVPYIYKLARGYSKQSPSHFVEAAIAEAIRAAKDA